MSQSTAVLLFFGPPKESTELGEDGESSTEKDTADELRDAAVPWENYRPSHEDHLLGISEIQCSSATV